MNRPISGSAHAVETGSTSEQILKQAPVGAHGYQIEVHTHDGRVVFLPWDLPKRGREKQPLEFWTLKPFRLPLGVPEGRHRIIYVSPTGEPLGDAILAYYPITAPHAPPSRAADPTPPAETDSLKLQQEQQRIAARAQSIMLADATVKNQAGQQANMQAMSQDLADAYRTVLENATAIAVEAVAASKKLLEGYHELMDAAANHAKRVAEAMPQQPPPPQDWAGVVKEGVSVLGDLAESWGVKRGKQSRLEESSKRIEINEQLPDGSEKEPSEAETAQASAGKGPDDSEPPSAPPAVPKARAAPPAASKESRQEIAKRSLRRVVLTCASVEPQHVMRFLHDAAFLRRFLWHLRLMMFPVTAWRWKPA